jgi:hypothetical protein
MLSLRGGDMIHIERPYGTLGWSEEDRTVTMEWRGYVDGEDYRSMLLALIELLESKSASRLLVDSRKAKAVTLEDQAWVNTVWSPKAKKAGLKFTAMLVPESTVGKMSLDRMRSKFEPAPGGDSVYFSDPAEAKAWLRRTPR